MGVVGPKFVHEIPKFMIPSSLLLEAMRSGTIASVTIMPLSPLFKAMGLRVGFYGPKFAALFVDNPQPWVLFIQHLIIGWISALPLLVFLLHAAAVRHSLLYGAGYGAIYYVAINSFALPMYFVDPSPWQLGWTTVYPSLIGHIIFGAAISLTSRRFISIHRKHVVIA